jgi:hypothetical protein
MSFGFRLALIDKARNVDGPDHRQLAARQTDNRQLASSYKPSPAIRFRDTKESKGFESGIKRLVQTKLARVERKIRRGHNSPALK